MTNFEAIKQMIVEQIAELMENVTVCDFCDPTERVCDFCDPTERACNTKDCVAANITWFNQEIPEPPKPMTINEYQELAMRTDNGDMEWRDSLLDGVLGLNGEAGECADIVKKYCFQKHDLNLEHLIEELGDVAWYLAKCASVIELDLEYIFKRNIEKLEARYPEGFDKERSVNRGGETG